MRQPQTRQSRLSALREQADAALQGGAVNHIELARLSRELRELGEEALAKRWPPAMRDAIAAERTRVRKALGLA